MAKTTDREHIRIRREEEKRLRLEREAAERRGRQLKALGIVLGALVVIGGIVALAIFGPTWFGPKAAQFTANGTVPVTTSEGDEVEVPITSQDGGAAIQVGQPDAPVTIDYWYDFSCPHCIDYHLATSQTIHDLAASGQAKINFRPIHIVAPYGQEAGAALLSVVQHQPESFFAVYDGLFLIPAQEQQTWGPAEYADAMGQFGVTDETILAEIRAGTMKPTVEQNTEKATGKDGIKGTPAVAVNGQIQSTLPDGPGFLQLVADNGGDLAQVPTASPAATEPAATEPASTEPAATPTNG